MARRIARPRGGSDAPRSSWVIWSGPFLDLPTNAASSSTSDFVERSWTEPRKTRSDASGVGSRPRCWRRFCGDARETWSAGNGRPSRPRKPAPEDRRSRGVAAEQLTRLTR